MDRIFLSGMKIYGHHGYTPEEREIGQALEVDLILEADLSAAGASDRLADTIDYGQAYQMVCRAVADGKHHLLEHLAADIARQALSGLPCQAATVRVSKLNPPVGGVCERAAVEMRRTRQDFGL